ncbi:MAG: response regulator [Desulfobulbaceae bacterium]|nr:response regulator [Desulfobulbaceae bacterium]
MENAVKPAILIVDDDQDQLDIVKQILVNFDVQCTLVLSGVDAVKVAKHNEFAVILMDVQMPGMGGVKTLELIRNFGSSKKTPIILMTALAFDSEMIKKAYQSGGVDYLFKPLDPVILQSKVQVFIEMYEQKQLISKQQEILNQHATELEDANLQLRQEISQHRLFYKTLKECQHLLVERFNKLNQCPPNDTKLILEEVESFVKEYLAFMDKLQSVELLSVDSIESVDQAFRISNRLMTLSTRNVTLLQSIEGLRLENKDLKNRLNLAIHEKKSNCLDQEE